MSDLPYDSIPTPPERVGAAEVLARLVDGLGFRYRWSTEGMRENDLAFRPCESSMSIGEVLRHIRLLVVWVAGSLSGVLACEPDGIEERSELAPDDWPGLRRDTLQRIEGLRALLLEVGDARLADATITGTPSKGPEPFWSMINGPLADALTHVGQISSWRRMAGNPATPADVFRGQPPRGD